MQRDITYGGTFPVHIDVFHKHDLFRIENPGFSAHNKPAKFLGYTNSVCFAPSELKNMIFFY